MDILDLILKYGLGAVALREIWMLRGEMRKGFESVTEALKGQESRLDDHESRIKNLEQDNTWRTS